MILNLETLTLDHLKNFKSRKDIQINVAECAKRMIESDQFTMFAVTDGDIPVIIIGIQGHIF